MSRAADNASPGPFIAGAEDPIPTGEFHDSPDDTFSSSNLVDFTNSPDTLQRLDAARKTDAQTFVSDAQFGLSTNSPNGSYHEYSDDSQESSKREGRTPNTGNSPGDMNMDGAFEASMDYDDYLDQDAPFMPASETDHYHPDGFLDDTSFMDRPALDFGQDFVAAAPPSSAAALQSPGMPTIAPEQHNQEHHRQNSQCSLDSSTNGWQTTSREASPMSNLVTSHKSTPSAYHTPSPPGAANFLSHHSTVRPDTLERPNQPAIDAALPHQHQFGVPMTSNGGFPPQLHFPQHQAPIRQPNFPQPHMPPQYQLIIPPDSPAKSRVETQITLKVILSPAPPGITKLHLPTQAISKPKLQAKPTPPPAPNMLELSVSVVCTSAMQQPELKEKALRRALLNPPAHLPPPNDEDENSSQNGAEVRICNGCMTRERKRAARKRVKNQEDENMWLKDEAHRVIVFNTQEVKDWEPCGELDKFPGALKVELPLRIACYCRHHNEKMGFNVIFTVKDYKLNPLAQIMSRPIMITDDHKTHPIASLTTQTEPSVDLNGFAQPPSGGLPNMLPQGQELPTPAGSKGQTPARTPPAANTTVRPSRTLSRPASPSQGGGPSAKKRKSSSSASRVPNSLAMTKLETSPPPAPQPPAAQQQGPTSPFNPSAGGYAQPEPMFAQSNNHGQFVANPSTPSVNEQPPFFHRSASMENLALAHHLYSGPPSSHPSRAPSPSNLMNGMHTTTHNNLSQTVTNGVMSMPMGGSQTRPPPVINKIIPNEGPKVGGVEVTILGREFWNGMVVYFGAQKAQTTTYWSECSVVCLLPPSPVSGLVPVTCERLHTAQDWNNPPPLFKYVDDSETKLMRLALECIGGKMNGKELDVSVVARQVLEKHMSSSLGGGQPGEPSSGAPMYNHAANEGLEIQLLKCLDVIDLDESPYKADLDRRSSTGQTMLHLSSSLGYRRLVAALLARGANPDEMDNGHCTPLHMAAIHNQPEIARRLMLAGANPKIRSLSGLTALDISESSAVTRAIRYSERRAPSQSRELSHRRASSASSLRSLWEPMSRIGTNDEPTSVDDGEESPEYTSGDFEDEDPDENVYLHMRRPSSLRQDQEGQKPRRKTKEELEHDLSPTSALAAALKDQFQQQLNQIQQAMTLHLQNLRQFPQIPQIPTLPGMPVLPDYQAYFQQAPFMRRMTQYMPGMSGSRPESQDGEGAKIHPPPAYEEIFPQQDMDSKQASAAQAAADAEADAKCATLYDEPSTSIDHERKNAVPSVLKIGRKNAITKEQQEQFLRAREEKLKRLSNDRNLFFIWIPLLILMVCAMLYSYFPSLFPLIWAFVRSVGHSAVAGVSQFAAGPSDRTAEG